MEYDNLRDRIGQAIADHLASLTGPEDGNTVTLDPFDSDNIDAIVDEIMPIVQEAIEYKGGPARV